MSVVTKSLAFVKNELARRQLKSPLIVGFSGPQGSGKSYATDALAVELNNMGILCVKFSMDDLYLTYEEQLLVTKKAKVNENKLLQGRGLPGTHDLQLCINILEDLKNCTNFPISIPIYDKSAYSGVGDRSEEIFTVKEIPKVVIFEGWFNGYVNLDSDQIKIRYLTSPGDSYIRRHALYQIEELNNELSKYCQVWDKFDAFIYLASDFENVFTWRLQQEHDLIQKKGKGMNDKEVRAFVERYMPMYELYYENLIEKGCPIIEDRPCLKLKIDLNRDVIP